MGFGTSPDVPGCSSGFGPFRCSLILSVYKNHIALLLVSVRPGFLPLVSRPRHLLALRTLVDALFFTGPPFPSSLLRVIQMVVNSHVISHIVGNLFECAASMSPTGTLLATSFTFRFIFVLDIWRDLKASLELGPTVFLLLT